MEDAAAWRGGGSRGGGRRRHPGRLYRRRLGARTLPTELYDKILHDPALRDPRGYIIPSTQPDFPRATEFVNALIKVGVTIHRATAAFTVNGKNYPAGSYVVKTAQAFRPHVLDMFEPQDHPNDFQYPGGPPIPPYDTTGWTLAYQMGVEFDRVLDGFDGPFAKIEGLVPPPPATVSGPATPAGYLISHQVNNSFKLINWLLKANAEVYWMKKEIAGLGTGAIWVPYSAAAKPVIDRGAKELGVAAQAVAKAPSGDALKLKPIRIGLYDTYGGSMPSGWTRWLFEQYDFNFERVWPSTLDAGDLKSKFDVIVFTDGAIRRGPPERRTRRRAAAASPDRIRRMSPPSTAPGSAASPTRRPSRSSRSSCSRAAPSSPSAAPPASPRSSASRSAATSPKRDPTAAIARSRARSSIIPGSLMAVNVDNTNPLAYGMPSKVDVVFDNSPVFRLEPTAEMKKTSAVAWFSGPEPLRSGWAWGQQYLDGGTAVAEATVGEGKVVLLGPEVNFRDQPHGTYKFLFNGLYYGSAKGTVLP